MKKSLLVASSLIIGMNAIAQQTPAPMPAQAPVVAETKKSDDKATEGLKQMSAPELIASTRAAITALEKQLPADKSDATLEELKKELADTKANVAKTVTDVQSRLDALQDEIGREYAIVGMGLYVIGGDLPMFNKLSLFKRIFKRYDKERLNISGNALGVLLVGKNNGPSARFSWDLNIADELAQQDEKVSDSAKTQKRIVQLRIFLVPTSSSSKLSVDDLGGLYVSSGAKIAAFRENSMMAARSTKFAVEYQPVGLAKRSVEPYITKSGILSEWGVISIVISRQIGEIGMPAHASVGLSYVSTSDIINSTKDTATSLMGVASKISQSIGNKN